MDSTGKFAWLNDFLEIDLTEEQFKKMEDTGIVRFKNSETGKWKHLYSKEFIDAHYINDEDDGR